MPIETRPLTSISARHGRRNARKPLSSAEIDAINTGMDRHAVLVLPGQDSDQPATRFTRNFGRSKGANSTVRTSGADPFADVSNLDKDGTRLARQQAAQRRWATGCGTRTPRSRRAAYSI